MFVDFFFFLRRHGLKVSLQEWFDLTTALAAGLAQESLAGFYHLGRCLLVKREAQIDLFDQCFAAYFRGQAAPSELSADLLSWLATAPLPRELDADELARLKSLDLDELRRQFEERLAEQKERHDGGSRWVGTGGTSPFGHSGVHPSGIRVGGEGRQRSAVQVATERRFRDLRRDAILDTRQLSLALRSLRQLARLGQETELALPESIAATAKNAGDIELVWRPVRKNTVKLLLLMDVGGSMDHHTRLTEQLFSAANSLHHFKEFRPYFFHNCIYDELYLSWERQEKVPTLELLAQLDKSWFLLIVGDAMMSPYELAMAGGRIDYYTHNAEPGLVWLTRLREKLPRSVWLNPEPREAWGVAQSVQMVQRVFPAMFPLSLDGLRAAIEALKRGAGAPL